VKHENEVLGLNSRIADLWKTHKALERSIFNFEPENTKVLRTDTHQLEKNSTPDFYGSKATPTPD
jgi:hypothetical protein